MHSCDSGQFSETGIFLLFYRLKKLYPNRICFCVYLMKQKRLRLPFTPVMGGRLDGCLYDHSLRLRNLSLGGLHHTFHRGEFCSPYRYHLRVQGNSFVFGLMTRPKKFRPSFFIIWSLNYTGGRENYIHRNRQSSLPTRTQAECHRLSLLSA